MSTIYESSEANERREIVLCDPKKLKVHPDVARFPECTGDVIELLADSMCKEGFMMHCPLLAHRDGDKILLIDGRGRQRAALACGLTEVPVMIDNKANPLVVALRSTLARRKLTKSTIALILWEAHPEIVNGAQRRKLANLVQNELHQIEGQQEREPAYAKLAAEFKVPKDYFAKFTRLAATLSAEDWEQAKQEILSGDVAVTSLYNGLFGGLATKDQPKNSSPATELLESVWSSFETRARFIDKLTQTERIKQAKLCVEAFSSAAPDWQQLVLELWSEKLGVEVELQPKSGQRKKGKR